MDLRGTPARKRPAGCRLHVPVPFEQVDPDLRTKTPPPTRRSPLGRLHPQLGKAPLLVGNQLAPANVRGVVHFQHHVRIVVLADGQVRDPGQLCALGVQIDGLVRLHEVGQRAVVLADPQAPFRRSSPPPSPAPCRSAAPAPRAARRASRGKGLAPPRPARPFPSPDASYSSFGPSHSPPSISAADTRTGTQPTNSSLETGVRRLRSRTAAARMGRILADGPLAADPGRGP